MRAVPVTGPVLLSAPPGAKAWTPPGAEDNLRRKTARRREFLSPLVGPGSVPHTFPGPYLWHPPCFIVHEDIGEMATIIDPDNVNQSLSARVLDRAASPRPHR